jgi:hypothetical protein
MSVGGFGQGRALRPTVVPSDERVPIAVDYSATNVLLRLF